MRQLQYICWPTGPLVRCGHPIYMQNNDGILNQKPGLPWPWDDYINLSQHRLTSVPGVTLSLATVINSFLEHCTKPLRFPVVLYRCHNSDARSPRWQVLLPLLLPELPGGQDPLSLP
jgi:hypothetical protein